jgi:hypothetical protein
MLRLPYDKISQSLRQVDLKKGPGHDYEKSIQVRYQVMEHIKPEHYYYQYQQIAWCYKALEQPDLAYEACLKAAENHTKDADGFNYLNIFIDSIFQLKNETTIHKKGMQYLLENALANSASDIAHYFVHQH